MSCMRTSLIHSNLFYTGSKKPCFNVSVLVKKFNAARENKMAQNLLQGKGKRLHMAHFPLHHAGYCNTPYCISISLAQPRPVY